MLKMIKSLKELDFAALMLVYAEGNRRSGQAYYPYLEREQQLMAAEQDFYQYLRLEFFHQEGDCYCLWYAESTLVSALRMEKFRDGWLLNALETHPDHRRKGYAKELITAVTQTFVGNIYSHISKSNDPSIAVHLDCGFQKIADSAAYLDGSYSTHAATYRK